MDDVRTRVTKIEGEGTLLIGEVRVPNVRYRLTETIESRPYGRNAEWLDSKPVLAGTIDVPGYDNIGILGDQKTLVTADNARFPVAIRETANIVGGVRITIR